MYTPMTIPAYNYNMVPGVLFTPVFRFATNRLPMVYIWMLAYITAAYFTGVVSVTPTHINNSLEASFTELLIVTFTVPHIWFWFPGVFYVYCFYLHSLYYWCTYLYSYWLGGASVSTHVVCKVGGGADARYHVVCKVGGGASVSTHVVCNFNVRSVRYDYPCGV